jgi:hypothetical protein
MENRLRRNLFMSTTLISLLLAVAFKFDNNGIHWFWSDKPQVAVVLVILGIVLSSRWLREARRLGSD